MRVRYGWWSEWGKPSLFDRGLQAPWIYNVNTSVPTQLYDGFMPKEPASEEGETGENDGHCISLCPFDTPPCKLFDNPQSPWGARLYAEITARTFVVSMCRFSGGARAIPLGERRRAQSNFSVVATARLLVIRLQAIFTFYVCSR